MSYDILLEEKKMKHKINVTEEDIKNVRLEIFKCAIALAVQEIPVKKC